MGGHAMKTMAIITALLVMKGALCRRAVSRSTGTTWSADLITRKLDGFEAIGIVGEIGGMRKKAEDEFIEASLALDSKVKEKNVADEELKKTEAELHDKEAELSTCATEEAKAEAEFEASEAEKRALEAAQDELETQFESKLETLWDKGSDIYGQLTDAQAALKMKMDEARKNRDELLQEKDLIEKKIANGIASAKAQLQQQKSTLEREFHRKVREIESAKDALLSGKQSAEDLINAQKAKFDEDLNKVTERLMNVKEDVKKDVAKLLNVDANTDWSEKARDLKGMFSKYQSEAFNGWDSAKSQGDQGKRTLTSTQAELKGLVKDLKSGAKDLKKNMEAGKRMLISKLKEEKKKALAMVLAKKKELLSRAKNEVKKMKNDVKNAVAGVKMAAKALGQIKDIYNKVKKLKEKVTNMVKDVKKLAAIAGNVKRLVELVQGMNDESIDALKKFLDGVKILSKAEVEKVKTDLETVFEQRVLSQLDNWMKMSVGEFTNFKNLLAVLMQFPKEKTKSLPEIVPIVKDLPDEVITEMKASLDGMKSKKGRDATALAKKQETTSGVKLSKETIAMKKKLAETVTMLLVPVALSLGEISAATFDAIRLAMSTAKNMPAKVIDEMKKILIMAMQNKMEMLMSGLNAIQSGRISPAAALDRVAGMEGDVKESMMKIATEFTKKEINAIRRLLDSVKGEAKAVIELVVNLLEKVKGMAIEAIDAVQETIENAKKTAAGAKALMNRLQKFQ